MDRILIHVMDKSKRNNREIFFCRFLIIGYLQNITHATNCADTRVDLQMLELAAQKGLASVSMSMIADKIGIKPSLYKHFKSKDEIVEAMYQFLRQQAKEKANIKPMDYNIFFEGKTALEILQSVVRGYIQMNQQGQMMNFYKVIYSEKPIF